MSFRTRNIRPLPKGCALTIGLFFLIIGITILIVVWHTMVRDTVKVRSWEEVPCTVLKAETVVDSSNSKPAMSVDAELAWEWKGTKHTGGGLEADIGFNSQESVNEMEEMCHKLRQQPQRTCWVNPDNPSEAVLKRPSWWPSLAAMTFCGIFIVLGAYVVISAIRKWSGTSPADGCMGMIFVLGLGAGATAGAIAVWWFGIQGAPDWDAISKRMKEVPGTIVSSREHESRSNSRGNKSVTYRPDIIFRYEWEGRTWHSAWVNYSRNSISTSNRGKTQAVLRKYPTGSNRTVWVDPSQPWISVLEKEGGTTWWLWIVVVVLGFFGLTALGFSLLKLTVILGAMLRRDKSAGGDPPAPPPGTPPPMPPPIPG